MKNIYTIAKGMLLSLGLVTGVAGMMAQNSLPAPGSGGSFQPNTGGMGPGGGGMGPGGGFGWNPGPPPSNWGSPWYSGWNSSPTIVVNPSTNFQNQGTAKVIACGYDVQGVWRVVPLLVSYQYNGVQYNVNVLNAWNPWTDMWDKGVDVPAYSTDYVLRNVTYDYYAVLSTGTYYFNL